MKKRVFGSLGLLSAGALVLAFSKTARKNTRDVILNGSEKAMKYGEQIKTSTLKVGKYAKRGDVERKTANEQEKYPSYIGYGTSSGLNESSNKETNAHKVNPANFKKSQNVMNDDAMPSKMAEIAEEFDLSER
ncbi:hypothetical protein JI666_13475 [Bacillus sp. NTK071]|uniref:hypothetical protein n=1 Tax=Bacillus sp. NTK071 TaxID=2802175 RepID=UPI001A8C1116|nr:hypothetical protein [Bacillus sp. NTK071]MBN8209761.1 hypothetical protein [Bacillus sp. NTK071]